MKNIYKLLSLTLVIITVGACSSKEDLTNDWIATNDTSVPPPEYSSGDLDFTNYVSVGNSLTAGLMDGALYTIGQDNSFPNILSGLFANAGGGTFNQPDINSENGFNATLNDISNAFDPAAAVFGRFILDTSIPGPVPLQPGEALNMVSDPTAINNLGVPGMRMIELTTDGYGSLNPFYTRFALSPTSGSVLAQAIAKNPSFMSLWLGNNDVLLWASGGGVGADGEDNPALDAQPTTLVSTTSFNAVVDGAFLAISGALPSTEIALVNIPNITLLPFFQAVAYNAIPLDAATAAAAQAGFDGYNQILNTLTDEATFGPLAITADEAAKRQVTFAEGQNAVLVVDSTLTDLTTAFNTLNMMGAIDDDQLAALLPYVLARQLKSVTQDPGLAQLGLPAEILTLSAGAELGTLADPNNPLSVIGVAVPLGDQFTLTTDELSKLLLRIIAFNAKLTEVATTYPNVVLVDANTFFTNIALNGGVVVDDFTLLPDFSPNGIFSTDGIHPNPRGHALMANEIIRVLESNFSADLPEAEVLSFRSVFFQ